MSIREIIEGKIKAAGLTKRETAARAGIHSGNINSMITAPSWPTLERLAAVLGLSVSDLVRDDQTAEPPTNPAGVPVCPRCGAPLVISITTPAGLQDESSTHTHDQTAAPAVQDDRGHAAPLP